MKVIKINNRFYDVPSAWNELSGRQLIACMWVFEQKWPIEKQLLKLIQILTGMSSWRFYWAPPDELADVFYLTEFLFTRNVLTKNVLPEYRKFYGPADEFNNMTVSEYIFCESHYQLYKEQSGIADLDNLCAVLYRPGKSNYDYKMNPAGDVREQFNDHVIGYYGTIINRWPIEVKLSILQFYEGCRAKLVTDFDDVFGGSGEPAKQGILSIVIGMAETSVFGDFASIEKMYLLTFMLGIRESIDKEKRIEEQYKSLRAS